MKIFVSQFALAAIILLSSCSNDDGPLLPDSTSITLISPAQNETDVATMPTLEWNTAGDLGSNDITYNLYVDPDPKVPTKVHSGTETSYTLTDPLSINEIYYWKVVARHGQGDSSSSAVGRFSTRDLVNIEATAAAGFSPRADHSSVVFDNKIWVIGGKDNFGGSILKNDVWYSSDGITWFQAVASAEFSPRFDHTSVVFDNKLWVIGGGGLNDVWHSRDGVSWTQATDSAEFEARSGHSSVVFEDKIWVIGGYTEDFDDLNDVWNSSDQGETWTQVSESASFSVRSDHTTVVFDNKMWLIGGAAGDNLTGITWKNDVWSSSDGANSTRESTLSREIMGHGCVVLDGRLWVIGGESRNGVSTNGIWVSRKGVFWQASTSAEFPPRAWHTMVVFDGKMWLMGGGRREDLSLKNDVWFWE